MSARDDGGPAFPMTGTEYNRDREQFEVNSYGGMSLRDYFAGQALIGAMATAQGLGTIPPAERLLALSNVAGLLYEVADAMIRERAK